MNEFHQAYQPVRRWSSTTRTWLRKISARLVYAAELAEEHDRRLQLDKDDWDYWGWLVGYDTARLLFAVFAEAEQLVTLVNDEDVDELTIRIAKVIAVLESRSSRLRELRLAHKLEAVNGRTPEEAAAFRLKAAELRRRIS